MPGAAAQHVQRTQAAACQAAAGAAAPHARAHARRAAADASSSSSSAAAASGPRCCCPGPPLLLTRWAARASRSCPWSQRRSGCAPTRTRQSRQPPVKQKQQQQLLARLAAAPGSCTAPACARRCVPGVPHLVPCKAERAQLRLQVPYHHAAVQGAGHQLAQAGVEGDARDSVAVAAEGALQRGVLGLLLARGAAVVVRGWLVQQMLARPAAQHHACGVVGSGCSDERAPEQQRRPLRLRPSLLLLLRLQAPPWHPPGAAAACCCGRGGLRACAACAKRAGGRSAAWPASSCSATSDLRH